MDVLKIFSFHFLDPTPKVGVFYLLQAVPREYMRITYPRTKSHEKKSVLCCTFFDMDTPTDVSASYFTKRSA